MPWLKQRVSKDRILTAPNLISLLRIIISIMLPFAASHLDIALLRILVAAIFLSDFLDGFLARKLNSVSEFGAILDPFADRLAVISVSISLNIVGRLPLPVLMLLFLREAAVVIGFLVLKRYAGKEVQVLPEGKKIAALVYSLLVSTVFFESGFGFYAGWLAVLLYYSSLYFYLKSIYSSRT
jgi:cardiolipin synthase